MGAFHLVTQASFCLCYLLNAKKDRTMFVSTCADTPCISHRYAYVCTRKKR